MDCGDVDVNGHCYGSGSGFSVYSRKVDDDCGNSVVKSGDSGKNYCGGDMVGWLQGLVLVHQMEGVRVRSKHNSMFARSRK